MEVTKVAIIRMKRLRKKMIEKPRRAAALVMLGCRQAKKTTLMEMIMM